MIRAAAVSLGYNALKTEQEQALKAFSRGKDVVVSLPMGYGRLQVAGNNNNKIILLRTDKLIFHEIVKHLLMTLYVVMWTIIEFRWNNSMYVMLPSPIPEK